MEFNKEQRIAEMAEITKMNEEAIEVFKNAMATRCIRRYSCKLMIRNGPILKKEYDLFAIRFKSLPYHIHKLIFQYIDSSSVRYDYRPIRYSNECRLLSYDIGDIKRYYHWMKTQKVLDNIYEIGKRGDAFGGPRYNKDNPRQVKLIKCDPFGRRMCYFDRHSVIYSPRYVKTSGASIFRYVFPIEGMCYDTDDCDYDNGIANIRNYWD